MFGSPLGAMAARKLRLPAVSLLRRLTVVSLLLNAVVWMVQYSLLLCDPPEQRVYRLQEKERSNSSTVISRWFHSSLSSHDITSVRTSCLSPNNHSDAGFTTLVAMGDIHLSVSKEPGVEIDIASLLQPVFNQISNVDAVVSSLASVVDTADKESLKTLRSLGLKLVSLANIPIHQAGDKARQITLQALESVGIRWLGVRVKQQEIVMIQGEKVGFLAFCAVHRHCVESSGLRYTPHKYTAKAATSAVGRLRGHGVSVIIVMVDWGHGHGLFPDEASMGVARHLASLRVTLVLGHHPAAVQGHAYLGETLVVFSMGKVLSSQQVASFCWRPEESKAEGWEYTESVGQCSQVHPGLRNSLRSSEQQTRLYRISIPRVGRAIAHYLSLPLWSNGLVFSPRLDDQIDWTLACGESDMHCLSCQIL